MNLPDTLSFVSEWTPLRIRSYLRGRIILTGLIRIGGNNFGSFKVGEYWYMTDQLNAPDRYVERY